MPLATILDLLQRRKELEQHLQLLFNRSCQWGRAERVRGAATIENLTQQLFELTEQIDAARARHEADKQPGPPAPTARPVPPTAKRSHGAQTCRKHLLEW